MAASQNHSGSADAALRTPAVQESRLQRAQLRTFGEAFDRSEIGARCLKCRDEAAIHQLAIHQDGTRTTLAFSATFLRASEPKLSSQDIQQALHGKDANRLRLSVYSKRKLAFAAVVFAAILEGVAHRTPVAHTASKISSGKSGTESKRVPSASSIALTIAGAGPSIGSSPIPLAPYAP